jgi:sugar phosphate isomerase/epimerase
MLAINTDYKASDDNPEPYLQQIAEAGFTHIHWCHHWYSDHLYSEAEINGISRSLQSLGLTVNDLHASAGKNAFYYSEDEAARLARVDLVKNRIHMANRIGTDVIVLHIPEQPEQSKENIDFWDAVHRSMDLLVPFARERNVRIAFENLFPANYITLEKVLAAFNPSDVGICYDPGHGNIVGGGLDFLEKVKDRLIALHLNDNDTTADQHNYIFSAVADWDRLARIIAASAYDKKTMTMELAINATGIVDEADFLAQAMKTGLKFNTMVKNARSGVE